MSLSETTTRVLVAAVGIPVGFAVVYVGGWALAILLVVVAVAAALEFYRLTEQKGVAPLRWPGAAIAALFIVSAAIDPSRGPEGSGFATLVTLAMLFIAAAGIWTGVSPVNRS